MLEPNRDYLNTVFAIGSNAVAHAVKMINRERTGGYFSIATETGEIYAVTVLGEVDEKAGAEKYLRNSIEKAYRLGSNPSHLSSYQSRNPVEEKWGGAVRFRSIFSFSGLPELWDEAVTLATAAAIGDRIDDFSWNNARAIVQVSHNPNAIELCAAMNIHAAWKLDERNL